MSPQADQFMNVAQEYCAFIESLQDSDDLLMDELGRLLPQLHAAITALGELDERSGYVSKVDLDQRFELYSRLHEVLGELDAYWMEFDVGQTNQEKSGSLADDLTDIYCDLKSGLEKVDKQDDVRQALSELHATYKMHWGQHLVDAERHLYELSAREMPSRPSN